MPESIGLQEEYLPELSISQPIGEDCTLGLSGEEIGELLGKSNEANTLKHRIITWFKEIIH